MAKSLRAKPIVERADNLLTNSALRVSRKTLRGWDVCFHDCGAGVFRSSADGTGIAPTGAGHVELSQSVRAWPNVRYRLDVDVEPTGRPKGTALAGKLPVAPGVEPTKQPADLECAGRVQVQFTSLKANEEIRTYEPLVMQVAADAPAMHRAVFQCPPGTGRLQVRLRIRTTRPIVVKRIRLVETGDYLLVSHVLANTPLPSREPPPCVPGRVLLCDGRKDSRPLLHWLQGVFGQKHVQRIGAKDLPALVERIGAKAGRPAVVIDLPAEKAPPLDLLLRLSDRLVVITSLATFAGAAVQAGLKGLRLQDRVSGLDMPCGKIILSGYYTRGFALADSIPYTWNDGQHDFAHRYLTMPKQAKSQLAEIGIRPAIVTECGQREIDNHPLTLYRPGKHGALLVMDPDGLEQPSPGEQVQQTLDLLWRSALGQEIVTLGQFSAPPTHYEGMMIDLVEVPKHYDLIEDLSILNRMHGKGNCPPTWLLPAERHDRFARRPTLHIRTGFTEADWPAVYGLILWLKRLALAAARNEPAGRTLLQRLRILAWPLTQPQNWRGCPKDISPPRSDLRPRDVRGQIDLQIGQDRQTVVLAPNRGAQSRVRQALGKAFVQVRVDPAAFADDPLAVSPRAKQLTCKILLPGIPQAFPASSPQLTDLVATVLERLALTLASQ